MLSKLQFLLLASYSLFNIIVLAKEVLFSSAFVCLLVNIIKQKLQDGLPQNLREGRNISQGRTHWTLVQIWIRGQIQFHFFTFFNIVI